MAEKKTANAKKESVEKKDDAQLENVQTEEIIDVDESGKESIQKTKNKRKQVRYIFKDSEKGWFEKERDNVRVTKYYRTQKEAVEAAKTHIRNSGMPGSIVIQSKAGKIRANQKITTKKI
ncbi:MAG TPA: DUF2188 domain-containing protein [Candidatus Ornithospirochaeta avicola]|uniref:DUF2188 domain-containing protein n=1 Tax=Candidatus Ornithospirochaeta avicola TaxID=2840896 RepID=A0A9D1PU56_9SPIO|nr:DUF2188 domain-containing protein [Candidatus Ornithospirochaeta avicola]